MNDAQRPDSAPLPASSANDRLDSWKEIAVYLKRDVTTVQRWEKREGLPVHRHVHNSQASVYAYPAELDTWWESHRNGLKLNGENGGTESAARNGLRLMQPRWVAAGVLVVAVLAGGTWLYLRPRVDFRERDWALIASFENRTGEAVLDGTIEHALERELSNSPFVNVIPRPRVNDTLALMRKPAETRLDESTGRELCLRDGQCRVLVAGSVEKFGGQYMITASLIEPRQGSKVASIAEEAGSLEQLLPALRRLSGRVRGELGETVASIRKSDQQLEKATTPSLQALHLFSQAVQLVQLRRCPAAMNLLKQAVAVDPGFATAYVYMGWCYTNDPTYFTKAFELSSTVPEIERLFIEGSYSSAVLKDEEKAKSAYEALLRLNPDHFYGNNNLAFAYWRLGRRKEALKHFDYAADLMPHSIIHQRRAGLHHALVELESAQPYADRLIRLCTPDQMVDQQLGPCLWALSFSLRLAWMQDDPEAVQREAAKTWKRDQHLTGEARDSSVMMVGQSYLGLGMAREAQKIFLQRKSLSGVRAFALANAAEAVGDRQALQEQAREYAELRPDPLATLGIYTLLRAGMVRDARRILDTVQKGPTPPNMGEHLSALQGAVLLAEGKNRSAIPLLERAVERMYADLRFFESVQLLAPWWEKKGQPEKAIQILKAAVTREPHDPLRVWNKNNFKIQLARLYRKTGNDAEARLLEEDLRKRLRLADANHVIVQELNQIAQTASAR